MSLLSLSDRGKALLLDSGGNAYLDKHSGRLVDAVKGKHPNSPYDVQGYSQEVIREQIDRKDFTPIKDYLFKEARLVEDLVLVMGTALRDKVLGVIRFKVEDIVNP